MAGNLRIAATVHGVRIVVVLGRADDEDIDACMATAARDRARGVLVFAPPDLRAPPPTAAQCHRLFNARGVRGVPTAVVSDSTAVRLVLKILAWLGTPLAAFSPTQLAEALEFLRVADDVRRDVHEQASLVRDIVLGRNATKTETETETAAISSP